MEGSQTQPGYAEVYTKYKGNAICNVSYGTGWKRQGQSKSDLLQGLKRHDPLGFPNAMSISKTRPKPKQDPVYPNMLRVCYLCQSLLHPTFFFGAI